MNEKVREDQGIAVPYERLEATVLRGIIEEFVLREGTDYGHAECTLEKKVETVHQQIIQGKIVVLFDPETESINLSSRA
jgi:uncharacterized protein YheU (UPF0270 family)